jgi:hypothetical protein
LLVYFYIQPSILFDERQENHFHFQLRPGLPARARTNSGKPCSGPFFSLLRVKLQVDLPIV